MRLIDEILRCDAVFDPPSAASLSSLPPEITHLVRSKNGALALSGALLVFGCLDGPPTPMSLSFYQEWAARADYCLNRNDHVFGADVFGDLLFVRNREAFRLDGETGERVSLGSFDQLWEQPLSAIADEFGGALGRERLAGRAIGSDPLRLLPTIPFMLQDSVRCALFEAPLTRALELKHRLFLTSRGAPDGAFINYGFWRAP